MSFESLQQQIIDCPKCPRLRAWAATRTGEKKEFASYQYWGKPVPGFGDTNGQLVVVGLAPGAHGANRTGRPFTGDVAGICLYRSLHKFGFANKSEAISLTDGLSLKNAYVTNAARCAPPDNKPSSKEFANCRPYLARELALLSNKKVLLALGGNAFNQLKVLYKELGAQTSKLKFRHGDVYRLGDAFPTIVGCYHTSQYNINTNRMSQEKLDEVFGKIVSLLGKEDDTSKTIGCNQRVKGL